MQRRKLDFTVISDIHLGTVASKAKELNRYLKSIQPKILIINGDLVDLWQIDKNVFPDEHIKVIRRLMKMMSEGTEVYYITGNHDEWLRRYSNGRLGRFHLVNHLLLRYQGSYHWFFHGDIFDVLLPYARFFALFGSTGFEFLLKFNRIIHSMRWFFGKERLSLSRRKTKKGERFVESFEKAAVAFASKLGYENVICSHIHNPIIKQFQMENGAVQYLNSGDWVEHLTALEFCQGKWTLIHYNDLNLNKQDLSFSEESIPRKLSVVL